MSEKVYRDESFTTTESDLEQARTRYAVLVRSCQDIQYQLATRNRVDEYGNRISGQEYWEWHQRAACALKHLNVQLRSAKELVKQLNVAKSQSDDRANLWRAWKLLLRCVPYVPDDVSTDIAAAVPPQFKNKP